MAIATECMTPGAEYEIHLRPESIEITIKLPHLFDITEGQAKHLEATLHNALELAIAPLFVY